MAALLPVAPAPGRAFRGAVPGVVEEVDVGGALVLGGRGAGEGEAVDVEEGARAAGEPEEQRARARCGGREGVVNSVNMSQPPVGVTSTEPRSGPVAEPARTSMVPPAPAEETRAVKAVAPAGSREA